METQEIPTHITEIAKIQAVSNEVMMEALASPKHRGTIDHDSSWHRTCEDTGFIRMITIKESPDVAETIQACWGEIMTKKGHPPGKRGDALITVYGTGS